ncbi:MAG TPA: hypothetical protein EYP85_05835 [Armatimonadetes bacterium]|nr:hypothetical protein [Armatimonadota bacterium]
MGVRWGIGIGCFGALTVWATLSLRAENFAEKSGFEEGEEATGLGTIKVLENKRDEVELEVSAHTPSGQLTERLRRIAGTQDTLMGKCRMVVKRLQQEAALAVATQPEARELAEEIRKRAQRVLRRKHGMEGK